MKKLLSILILALTLPSFGADFEFRRPADNTLLGTWDLDTGYRVTATWMSIQSTSTDPTHRFFRLKDQSGADVMYLTENGNMLVEGRLTVGEGPSGSTITLAGQKMLFYDPANPTSLFIGGSGEGASGIQNTTLGFKAGANLTTGYDQTLIGAFAGEFGTNNFWETAVGFRALQNNTSGFQQVAIGGLALGNNYLGTRNTAVGSSALSGGGPGTGGSSNTAVGYTAGFQTVGSGNVFLGYRAGRFGSFDNQLIIATDPDGIEELVRGDFLTGQFSIGFGVYKSTFTATGDLELGGDALKIGGVTYEFPLADGTVDYVLKTDGAGNLDWVSNTGASGDTQISGMLLYNQVTNTVINSVNVSSVTDVGSGIFRANWTTPMTDTDYYCLGTASTASSAQAQIVNTCSGDNPTGCAGILVGSASFHVQNHGATNNDVARISIICYGSKG